MSNKINMIGIIDGDVLIYRACYKALKDKLNVKVAFDEIYQGVQDEIQCDKYSLHVSGKGNFRKELQEDGGLPSYPHPRRRPELWPSPSASMGLNGVNSIYYARLQNI